MVEAQNAMKSWDEIFMFIADWHALTSLHDAEMLRQYRRDTLIGYLSCWIDPEKITLYAQSDIPEIQELTWYLSTITPFWLLQQAHSYKDKVAKWIKPSCGLFTYPVLMAADILIADADIIPVWKDQVQHVEMTRDIWQKFNNEFWEVFRIPEYRVEEDLKLIPWIDGQKMSKSYNNTIPLFWDEASIKKSVMSIVTDSAAVEDKKDSSKCNIFALYRLFANQDEIQDMEEKYSSWGFWYWDAKKQLLAKISEYYWPMWERQRGLESKKGLIDEVRQLWAKKMRSQAQPIMEKVRKLVWIR